MAGEKRVLRVGVANISEPLQAKLQCRALLPEIIGEGLAKRFAMGWRGRDGERAQCASGADFGDQRHRGAPGCRASRPSIARFGGERRDVRTKSGDLAQKTRRLDRLRALATDDRQREGAYSLMRSGELANQARMYVRA